MTISPVSVSVSPFVQGNLPQDRLCIAVYKTDRLYADGVAGLLAGLFPQAEVRGFCDAGALTAYVESTPVELLVSGLSGQADEQISRLADWKKRRWVSRILLVTSRKEPLLLLAASRIPVEGAMDTRVEGGDGLGMAVAKILSGGIYFSASITGLMFGLLAEGQRPDRILTAMEQRVLAVIGRGVDDRTAAAELTLSVHTVRKHRENIHRKLGVQSRNELMAAASRLGAVAS